MRAFPALPARSVLREGGEHEQVRGAVLTEAHIKERLSMAYVDAIAGRAGVNTSHELHDYGVDGTLQTIVKLPSGYVGSGFPVQYQLKATVNWAGLPGHIVYDLEAKAYAAMVERDPSAVPLVLLLMCLPKEDHLWLQHNERVLLLKNCCYWLWLPGGSTAPANKSTVRVHVPRTNRFTVPALLGIMGRARDYQRGVRNDV
jgi:hypothetical protein